MVDSILGVCFVVPFDGISLKVLDDVLLEEGRFEIEMPRDDAIAHVRGPDGIIVNRIFCDSDFMSVHKTSPFDIRTLADGIIKMYRHGDRQYLEVQMADTITTVTCFEFAVGIVARLGIFISHPPVLFALTDGSGIEPLDRIMHNEVQETKRVRIFGYIIAVFGQLLSVPIVG